MAIVKWGFRRFYSSRQSVSEISELVAGSNVQQSERSSAASVTSKKPIRGKVAIAARKKMLESFVDKYRAMNQGKFPTPSSAKKEVGGSYYFVKKVLQEMEYNIKVSSVEKESVEENKSKTIMKELAIESSSESQEGLDSQITMDQKFYEDRGLESVSNLDTNFDFKEGLQPSTSNADTGNSNVTRDDTLDIVTECHDRQGQLHEKLEQNLKDESLLGDNFAFKDSDSTAAKRHDEIQNITSDIPEQQKDEKSKAEQHDEAQNISSEIPEQQKDEESETEQHDEIQNITSDMPGPQKEESKAEKQHETQNIKSDIPEQQKDEELKAEQKHDKIQNITSDMPEKQKDEEFREKPSLWGNLKMLATGLINIWKK
ncbi:hypothetical protein Tco_0126854 [Tanacetum coccineum]